MTDPKEKKDARRVPGPKTKRPVIPTSFQISRVSPMRQILDEAEGSSVPVPPSPEAMVEPTSQVPESRVVTETTQEAAGLVGETSLVPETSLVLQPSLDASNHINAISAEPAGPVPGTSLVGQTSPSAPTSLVPSNSQVGQTSLVAPTRQVDETSLGVPTSLVPEQSHGWSPTSLVPEPSQVDPTRLVPLTSPNDVDLFAGLPEVEGYLQIPNRIADHLLPLLSPHSQLVYLRLYRLSWGFNKPYCTVSLPKLAEKTQLSQSSVQRAVGDLEAKGLIRKAERIFGKSKVQGITYEVVIGTSLVTETRSVSRTSPVREPTNKVLKDTSKTEVSENPIYAVRRIAARLREIHLSTPNYTMERLRADVRTAIDGQGLLLDDATIDDALRGLTI